MTPTVSKEAPPITALTDPDFPAGAPFGATSPTLNIARKHGIYYGDALIMADFYLRRRGMPEHIVVTYNQPMYGQLRADLKAVAEYWYPAFHTYGSPDA